MGELKEHAGHDAHEHRARQREGDQAGLVVSCLLVTLVVVEKKKKIKKKEEDRRNHT